MKDILIFSLIASLFVCFFVVFIITGIDFVDNFKVDYWGAVRIGAFMSFFISFFIIAFLGWVRKQQSL